MGDLPRRSTAGHLPVAGVGIGAQLQRYREDKKSNMHPLKLLICVFSVCLGCTTTAQQPTFVTPTEQKPALPTPNESVSGAELFVACSFCHGASGEGSDRRDGPALAGLDPWYIEAQLTNFKDGRRGYHADDVPGQVMYYSRGMLRNAETISSLAEYISTLEPGVPMPANARGERPYLWEKTYAGLDPSITPDTDAGEKTYSTVCVACHGTDGAGNEALGAANILYLSEAYMTRQLKYFKDGLRGAHPDDIRGQQMAAIAKTLPDEQSIADVVAYIATLGGTAQ